MSDNLHRPKLKSEIGEAWCYYSKSGKTAEVYVRILGVNHNNAIRVVVPCYPPKKRKAKEANRG